MNTDELDAWFEKADDVLTDWNGSDDSARWADGSDRLYQLDAPLIALTAGLLRRPRLTPPRIGHVSIDVRFNIEPMRAALERMAEQFGLIAEQMAAALPNLDWSPPRSDVRAYALAARQNRNTGPTDRRRLDQRRPHRR